MFASLTNRRILRFEKLEDRDLLSVTGDYDAKGQVDAGDYVTWRKNAGTAQGYTIWQSHFGNDQLALPGAFNITSPAHGLTTGSFTVAWDALSNAIQIHRNSSADMQFIAAGGGFRKYSGNHVDGSGPRRDLDRCLKGKTTRTWKQI
jgi:hypothetical protein